MKLKQKWRLSIWQLLTLGYLGVILLGTLLLMLPFATRAGETTTWLNALFTSTSATCVTGLVIYDTATHWTLFGQLVIIALIQLGGLGFMTVVSMIFRLLGKDMGLYANKALMLSTGGASRSNLKRLFYHIVLGTVLFESLGAILLALRFVPQFGAKKGIYFALWHSVSAFCNAGFDLMGGVFSPTDRFVSFTHYATDPLISLTLCALIIIGGLGFCVWEDIIAKRGRFRRFTLHTKLVLITTASLLILSTLLFLLFERNRFDSGLSLGSKLLISFFNATTPRTAGFNTTDLSTLSDSGYLLMLVLMFVGGSSASTAGGIKITTLFVILAGILAVFRGKRDIELGKKRLSHTLVSQALAIFVSCLMIVLCATLVLCAVEEQNELATMRAVLFETFSAMGTVGLSLGLTPTLKMTSRIVLILLMYAGRVGILTLALAFGERRESADIKRPLDNILIG